MIIETFLTPEIEHLFGKIDVSGFDEIRGNPAVLAIGLVQVWIFAGFGEEFVFRGFLLRHIARLLGNQNYSWIISIFLTSAFFGLAHQYQGAGGMISCGILGLIFGFIYWFNKQNLWLNIILHGFYDTFSLTLIYFNHDTFFSKLIFNF
jgi:hypothetical protein